MLKEGEIESTGVCAIGGGTIDIEKKVGIAIDICRSEAGFHRRRTNGSGLGQGDGAGVDDGSCARSSGDIDDGEGAINGVVNGGSGSVRCDLNIDRGLIVASF